MDVEQLKKTSPLEEARIHRDKISDLLEVAKNNYLANQDEESAELVDTLTYTLSTMRDHYKNHLHCQSIYQKKKGT